MIMAQVVSSIDIKLSADEAKQAIAEAIKDQLPPGFKVKAISFKIEEVGGDPMDRYPGTDTVTGVTVSAEKEPERVTPDLKRRPA